MSTTTNSLKAFFATLIIALSINTASAESNAKSRIAVVANDVKTNIWVSDFPKNTGIAIYDTENNLLSMTSTNDYGATFLSLPKGLQSGVIVKTIDGETSASNKAVIKNKQTEQNITSTYQDDSNKA